MYLDIESLDQVNLMLLKLLYPEKIPLLWSQLAAKTKASVGVDSLGTYLQKLKKPGVIQTDILYRCKILDVALTGYF